MRAGPGRRPRAPIKCQALAPPPAVVAARVPPARLLWVFGGPGRAIYASAAAFTVYVHGRGSVLPAITVCRLGLPFSW